MGEIEPAQQFAVRWAKHVENFYQMTEHLLATQAFTDVIISTNGGEIVKGHKIVLAANSDYFQELFMNNPCKNTSIILQDISISEMTKLMDYMYTGQTTVTGEELKDLIAAGECLRIKGLTDPVPPNAERAPPSSHAPTISSGSNDDGISVHGHAPLPSTPPAAYESSPKKALQSSPWAPCPILPQLHNAISELQQTAQRRKPSILSNSYVKPSEKSPLSRKKRSSAVATDDHTLLLKTVLDHVQAQQQYQDLSAADVSYQSSSNNTSMDYSRRGSADFADFSIEDDLKPVIRARRTSNNKPKIGERKYKQYTPETIKRAIQIVKEHKMGALEASKHFNIPSRTLYDKLKKAGVEPARMSSLKRSADREGAQFPYMNGMKSRVYGKTDAPSETGSLSNGLGSESTEESHRITRSSENLAMDVSERDPSPSRSVQNDTENGEAAVENLSVSKRSNNIVADVSVIVQPNNVAVKEEIDTADSKTASET